MNPLKLVRAFAKNEPALSATILTWVAGAACGIAGKPDWSGVLVAAGLAMLGIRSQVVPAEKAEAGALDAARSAAQTVAEQLNSRSAGALGEITETGQQVVDDAVSAVQVLIGGKT